jgi:hypothetical protein
MLSLVRGGDADKRECQMGYGDDGRACWYKDERKKTKTQQYKIEKQIMGADDCQLPTQCTGKLQSVLLKIVLAGRTFCQ